MIEIDQDVEIFGRARKSSNSPNAENRNYAKTGVSFFPGGGTSEINNSKWNMTGSGFFPSDNNNEIGNFQSRRKSNILGNNETALNEEQPGSKRLERRNTTMPLNRESTIDDDGLTDVYVPSITKNSRVRNIF